ncbi:T9SS type A sorting domain-containing protein [Pontibacter ruber]|uniref:T9SS type A sorting domain-containing protein n=1 Tax=Pontibacter ruber TaxID=1343895 RepID=A0ABW5CX50_9BACT|nr:T9SS type A sorting domain-containing protein [Pontibacter ruber]
MKTLLTLLLLLGTACVSLAQNPLQYRLRPDVPVSQNGRELPAPWNGGLNTPQFSTIDLNKDGREDLFIFDRMLRKVFTYLAVQEQGNWRYKYSPEYEVLFPEELEHWVLLRDYNCDGLKDIFTSTSLGIRVYRQEATTGAPTFVLAEDYLKYNSKSNSGINMQMNTADMPAIVDMDGDGDLDILLTEFSAGQTLEYFKNMQVEQGQACGTLQFTIETNWWGQITECHGCNNFGFGVQCRVAAPLHSGHDGSALLALDLDADGDRDLLMGNVACDNLIKMENVGTSTTALMQGMDTAYPANTQAAKFNLFPAAFYEDVTFDGIPDLLVAPGSNENEGNLEVQRSVWLYRNKGQHNQPDFEFVQDNFLQEQMIDLGEGAYPAFADVDGDGKQDMLVGNNASLRNGKYVSSLSFYKNTGTTATPAYTLVTDDYLELAAQELWGIKPAFADLNGDKVPDLVLTYRHQERNTTRVAYIPNTASAGQTYQFSAASLATIQTLIDGDSPTFYDINGDGKPDMLIGKANGGLDYYRNTGTATLSAFTLEKESLGGIGFNVQRRNLSVAIADVNADQKPDLLTVDDSGALRLYLDFLPNLNGTLTGQSELLQNTLTNKKHTTRLGKNLSIAVAGNGMLAVGSLGGGLYLLEQASGPAASPENQKVNLALKVYPNPLARGEKAILQVEAAEAVAVELHDMIGRKVYAAGAKYNQFHTLSLPELKAGIYMLRATRRDGGYQVKRVVIQ